MVLGAATLSGTWRLPEGASSQLSPTRIEGAFWALPVADAPFNAPKVPQPAVVELTPPSVEAWNAALQTGGAELGAVSFGAANRGALFNATRLDDGPFWHVVDPHTAFGTAETVRAIEAAVSEVNRLYPDSPVLSVGHLSRAQGGWLRPHRSHQSGRDADIGLYYVDGAAWYRRATPESLDVRRTWALISSLLKVAPVQYLFLARSLHSVLRAEAVRIGEDADFVRDVFDGDGPRTRPILRHARGHQTHLHVRFLSAAATENARRVQSALGRLGRNRGSAQRVLVQRQRQREKAQKTPSKLHARL